MEKEFVPYEEALSLKELGFDEFCFGYYGVENEFVLDTMKNTSPNYSRRGFTSAPLYQQAFRWFREKYELYAWVKIEYEYGGITPTYYITGKRQGDIAGGAFKTYKEAELECLKKLIEIVKNK
jgi:hypothetical protein